MRALSNLRVRVAKSSIYYCEYYISAIVTCIYNQNLHSCCTKCFKKMKVTTKLNCGIMNYGECTEFLLPFRFKKNIFPTKLVCSHYNNETIDMSLKYVSFLNSMSINRDIILFTVFCDSALFCRISSCHRG